MRKRIAPIIMYIMIFTFLVYNPSTTKADFTVVLMGIVYCISLVCLYLNNRGTTLIYYAFNYTIIFYMVGVKGLEDMNTLYVLALSLSFLLAVLSTFFKDISDIVFLMSVCIMFVIAYNNPISSLYKIHVSSSISSLLFFVSSITMVGYVSENPPSKRKKGKSMFSK